MKRVVLRKMHTRILDYVSYMRMTRKMTRRLIERLLIIVASLAKNHKRLKVVSMTS